MDPALLLDTLSPDDMEMWQCGYNFFNEENWRCSEFFLIGERRVKSADAAFV